MVKLDAVEHRYVVSGGWHRLAKPGRGAVDSSCPRRRASRRKRMTHDPALDSRLRGNDGEERWPRIRAPRRRAYGVRWLATALASTGRRGGRLDRRRHINARRWWALWSPPYRLAKLGRGTVDSSCPRRRASRRKRMTHDPALDSRLRGNDGEERWPRIRAPRRRAMECGGLPPLWLRQRVEAAGSIDADTSTPAEWWARRAHPTSYQLFAVQYAPSRSRLGRAHLIRSPQRQRGGEADSAARAARRPHRLLQAGVGG